MSIISVKSIKLYLFISYALFSHPKNLHNMWSKLMILHAAVEMFPFNPKMIYARLNICLALNLIILFIAFFFRKTTASQ